MPTYLEFEVSLLEIEPRIWRRFQLDANATFGDLHLAIQDSFDWDKSHLWDFRTKGRNRRALAGLRVDDMVGLDRDEIPDAWSVNLTQHFRRVAMTCQYVYDYGDNWVHAVKLRQRVTSAERFQRRLIAGSRAAPQEDSGGIWGYWRLVELVETGNDPWGYDPDELPGWIDDWKPDEFDLDAARTAFDG